MKDTPSIPLIILDVQDAIDQPVWNGKSHPGYLSVIQRLLWHWRSSGWPVLHVKHDEENPTPAITFMALGMGSRKKWHR
ncbi:hypothetical protein [Pseudomonas juntendi]|uniref:hypothetical protein n=1 Tax=Pseudomonas juntendi TaxID=2666183 RepID=UPI0030164A49